MRQFIKSMNKKHSFLHPGFKNKYVSFGLALVSRIFCLPHLFDFFYLFEKWLWKSGYIRAVNYHDVPSNSSASFETQLSFFKKYFADVSLQDLDFFIRTGIWSKNKPGIILSFDDGLRSSYSVIAPLLEKYGYTGWFLIPSHFIDVPVSQQKTWATEHLIDFYQDYPDGRIAMSWKEIKELDKHHVIVSHTRNHMRLRSGLPEKIFYKEIVGSKADLEQRLEHEIKCFGWVGGEMASYDRKAARCITNAGYDYALMTKSGPILPWTSRYQLHRTFLGSDWPGRNVKLHLSGILDVLYYPQRKRINRMTFLRNRAQ
jgi:peptidoglycan/xylan/chitin deacetylase (PgdA/CDA1 family)